MKRKSQNRQTRQPIKTSLNAISFNRVRKKIEPVMEKKKLKERIIYMRIGDDRIKMFDAIQKKQKIRNRAEMLRIALDDWLYSVSN